MNTHIVYFATFPITGSIGFAWANNCSIGLATFITFIFESAVIRNIFCDFFIEYIAYCTTGISCDEKRIYRQQIRLCILYH